MGLVVICGLILRLYRNEFTAVGGSLRFRIATFIEVTGQKGAVLLGGAFVILLPSCCRNRGQGFSPRPWVSSFWEHSR